MGDNRAEIIIAVKDMASASFKTLTDATKSYDTTLRELGGSANQVSGTIRNLFLAFGGYTVIKEAISTGYKFNSTIEETRVGIGSLIFSMNNFRDSSGQVVTGTEAFNAALDKSKDVQDELRIAGLKTAATYEQLTKAYSQSYVPAIRAGFDESQIVKFTVAATQAATAMRVPLDMLGEEVRSILSGNMTARNTILMPIIEAAGLTNQKIKELAASGQLYEQVMKALEGATVGADVASKNYSVVLSNLKDAVSQLLGQGLSQGFEKVKGLLIDLTNQIVTFDEKTNKITFNPEIINTIQRMDRAIFSAIESTKNLAKETYGFTQAHPVIVELGLDFAKIALELAGVMIALRKLGELIIWLTAVQTANLVFVDSLVASMWALTASTTAAGGAALALGAAFGTWQLVRLSEEIWGAITAYRELNKVQDVGKQQQNQFAGIIAEFNRQTGFQVKDMLELGKVRAENNLIFDKENGLWIVNVDALGRASGSQKGYTSEVKQAGEAETKFILTHEAVNQGLDRMNDALTASKEKLKEFQLDIAKLSSPAYEGKLFGIDKEYEKEVAAAKKRTEEMTRAVREMREKVSKAETDAAQKNKKRDTDDPLSLVDPKVYDDLKAAEAKLSEIRQSEGEVIAAAGEKKTWEESQAWLEKYLKDVDKAWALEVKRNEDIGSVAVVQTNKRQTAIDELTTYNLAALQAMLRDTVTTEEKKREVTAAIAKKMQQDQVGVFEALKAGWNEVVGNMRGKFQSTAQYVLDYGKQLAEGLHTSISDTFYARFTGKLNSIKDIWSSFTEGLKNSFFRMVSDIAAKKIIMWFSSMWDESKGPVSGKGTIETLLGIDVPILNFGAGGSVPGSWNGKSGFAGDTVRAMLTPEEYVVRRDVAKHPVLGKIIRWWNEGGGNLGSVSAGANIPAMMGVQGLAEGGEVMAPGIPHYGWFSKMLGKVVSTLTLGASDIVGITHGGYLPSAGSYISDIMSGRQSFDFFEMMQRLQDPAGIAAGPIRGAGAVSGGSVNQAVGYLGPILGAVVGGAYGGPLGAAGGAYVGSNIASQWDLGYRTGSMNPDVSNAQQAAIQSAIAAATAYVAAEAGSYVKTDAGGVAKVPAGSLYTDAAGQTWLQEAGTGAEWAVTKATPYEIAAASLNGAWERAQQAGTNFSTWLTDVANMSAGQMWERAKVAGTDFLGASWEKLVNLPANLFNQVITFDPLTYVKARGTDILSHVKLALSRMSGGELLDASAFEGALGIGGAGEYAYAKAGADYIPYDNFPVVAHKAERILSAADNQHFGRMVELLEKLVSGGGSLRGMNISINVGGDQFDARIRRVADGVRVDAEERNMGSRRIYS